MKFIRKSFSAILLSLMLFCSMAAFATIPCPTEGTTSAKCMQESGPNGEYTQCSTLIQSNVDCKFTPSPF